MNRLLNDLFLVLMTACLRLSLWLLLSLRGLNVKELFIVDMSIFEELLGVLMELFIADLIPHFEDLAIEHGFSLFSHQFFDKGGSGREQLLIDAEFLFLHFIKIKCRYKSKLI